MLFFRCNNFFDSFFKRLSGQREISAASVTDDSYIRAASGYGEYFRTARMLFLQTQLVLDLKSNDVRHNNLFDQYTVKSGSVENPFSQVIFIW